MKTLLKLIMLSCVALVTPAMAQNTPAAAPAAPAAETEPTQETSEGAIKLFIKAMQAGDFEKVVTLCDPGAEAYNDLQQMAEALSPDKANPNLDKAQLEMIREFFTKPWQNLEHKLVVEQGPRAQYKLDFFTMDTKTKKKTAAGTRTIDLNKIDDKWFVIVTAELMRPAAPTTVPGQAPKEEPTPSGDIPVKSE